MRISDVENLGTYYTSSQNQSLKYEILSELLRTAACEKSRAKAMHSAKEVLKSLSILNEHDLEGLIKFYGSKNIGKISGLAGWRP